jgi:trigger factor
VKTDVEELSPTRIRLTVEVPFDELQPSLDQTYRQVARQVRIPGFRPGRAPRQVIDRRIGRDAMVEQAVNDAVPELYGKALREADVFPLGQPEMEITRIADGEEVAFTAEVDVRPKFEVPDTDGLAITVDDADVGPDQVEEYLGALRERFASLRTVSRPAQAGDFVSIDLSATVNGKQAEDAQATGISYEVGSGTILDGLDEAVTGLEAEQSGTFQAELAGGQHAGQTADVTITVRSVKVKELPELDDEFAQAASEFDTIGELRADTRRQLESVRRAGQLAQARERVIEALVASTELPLPDALLEEEVEHRRRSLTEQLQRAGLTLEPYLQGQGQTEAELEREMALDARRSITGGFILDAIAEQDKLVPEQEEIGRHIAQQAYRLGVPPDQLARQLSEQGQIGAIVAEVLRSKALALITDRATVTDESGRPVALTQPDQADAGQAGDQDAAEPGDQPPGEEEPAAAPG